ncbi:transketolase [Actinotalea sp. JY-7885]|uniref:transketolase n=1 Tax=Actinotalea sp. JY-7885 TaxID=2758576 RepID=UPI00165EAD44|nr:transketolase [Actinotalea sp. JY-7885]
MTTTTPAAPTLTSPAHLPDALMRNLSRVTGDEKHDAAAHSTLDVLWVLHTRVLRVAPETPERAGRDRFLLSKGHGPASYYAVLATLGFFPEAWLDDLAGTTSPLGHHPDRLLVPGVEISSGSLGHGLPIAVGLARGLGITGEGGVVHVLVGDAELDEGSNHEAMAIAGRWRLDRLRCVVVDNDSTSLGWPGGIARRFEVEGWSAAHADARDHDALEAALTAPADGPHVTVVRTARKAA